MGKLTTDDLARFVNVELKDASPEDPDPRRQELQTNLDAALAAVEERTGPIWTREVLYSVRPVGGLLILPATKLQAVLGVTGPGGEVPLSDFGPGGIDLHAGMLWLPGAVLHGPHVVSVRAGSDEPPRDLVLSVLYVAGHLHTSQRGRSARTGAGDDRTGPAPGWAIPYAAQTLMAPHLLPLDARST